MPDLLPELIGAVIGAVLNALWTAVVLRWRAQRAFNLAFTYAQSLKIQMRANAVAFAFGLATSFGLALVAADDSLRGIAAVAGLAAWFFSHVNSLSGMSVNGIAITPAVARALSTQTLLFASAALLVVVAALIGVVLLMWTVSSGVRGIIR